MKKVFWYGVLIGIFGGIFWVESSVWAISISPLRHTVVVESGSTTQAFVDIKNDTDHVLNVFPEVDAFSLDPESGAVQFGKADAAKTWVSGPEGTLEILPQQQKRMVFTITVPREVEVGSHYLGLFVKEKAAEGQVGIGARVGSLLFLHVAGNMEERLYLQDFSSQKKWYTNGVAQMFVQVKNEGTIHVLPKGKIVFTDRQGAVRKEISLNEEERKVLPGEIWKLKKEVLFGKISEIGRWDAHLVLGYGITEQVVSSSISFWYVPMWVLVGGIFGIIVLFGGVFWLFYKMKK